MQPAADRRPVARALWGPPGPGRAPVVQALLWAVLNLCCAGLYAVAASHGMLSVDRAAVFIGLGLGQSLLIYALVRSGLGLHWCRHPSIAPVLTCVQMGLGVLTLALAYTALGEGRSALVGLPWFWLLFGALALQPRQTVHMGLAVLVGLVVAIAWMAWQAPAPPVRRVELFHLAVAVVGGSVATALALHLSQLMQRLYQQEHMLQATLSRMESMATRDELTGAANRRHLHEVLAQAVERAHRHGLPFCVALIEVDQFRGIIDRHGHAVAERVLRGFAELTARHVRALDVVGRWSGENFLLVMPSSTLREAEPVLERLRHHIGATAVGGLQAGTVTVSAGLAQYRPGEAVTLMLERVDCGLHMAKRRGRNSVHQTPSPLPAEPALHA